MKKQNVFIRFTKASFGFSVEMFHITAKNGFRNLFRALISTVVGVMGAVLNIVNSENNTDHNTQTIIDNRLSQEPSNTRKLNNHFHENWWSNKN